MDMRLEFNSPDDVESFRSFLHDRHAELLTFFDERFEAPDYAYTPEPRPKRVVDATATELVCLARIDAAYDDWQLR